MTTLFQLVLNMQKKIMGKLFSGIFGFFWNLSESMLLVINKFYRSLDKVMMHFQKSKSILIVVWWSTNHLSQRWLKQSK